MEEKINKMPNWLRYVLAIPFGIILVILIGIVILISNSIYSDIDSLWFQLITFLYKNGINVIVFFWGVNSMLPAHRFTITLIISIIFGIIYTFIEGMAFMVGNISLEYILAYIEIIICLIISCYYSFNKKFE